VKCTVSLGRKVVRAFLMGSVIGIIAGLGFYYMTDAINMMAAAAPPYNPIAIMMLTYGFIVIAAIAIELSEDIAEDTKNGTNQMSKP